jgi:cytochrome c2
MLQAHYLTRTLVILSFGLLMFMLGVAVHKYKPFPYRQLGSLSRIALSLSAGRDSGINEVMKEYSRDTDKISLERFIDTGLLPLRITGLRLSEHYPVAKVAGAISTIDNTVLVLDRLGNIYSCSTSGDVNKLSFPPLPNNISEYLQAGFQLDSKTLRAYSIRYMSEQKLLVVSHEAFDAKADSTRMAVSIIGIDSNSLKPVGTWNTIFLGDLEPNGSNDAGGGRLAVYSYDRVLLTVGDYNINDPMQHPKSTFGKIIEINTSTLERRVLSTGHRNPQGLVVTKDREIFSTEHGPAGGDELNLIIEGNNYGWPVVTLGTDYNTYRWRDELLVGKHAGYQLPLFAWIPSIAVSNVVQIDGFSDRWDGDLLVASLKAQSLFRLRLNNNRVLYSEPIWIGQRVRDIAQLRDGTIALWTDDSQLLFMSVDNGKLTANTRLPTSISDTLIDRCMFCHHFGPTSATHVAPSLSGLFERKIASDNFRYTAALRTRDGPWTDQTLRAFLSNPGRFANGTSMPPPNLTSEEIDEVIRVLKHIVDTAK